MESARLFTNRICPNITLKTQIAQSNLSKILTKYSITNWLVLTDSSKSLIIN